MKCPVKCNQNSGSARVLSVLLLLVLAATALFLAFLSNEQSPSHLLWRSPDAQAMYAGSYGVDAIANLSDFRSGLLATVVDYFDPKKAKPKGFKRFDNLKPIISCPPDRPLTRYGGSADGGKLLCDISALPSPCLIYSLGSNGDYSFELDMLKTTTCDTHTFDCTYKGTSQHPSRHFYHQWCLGSSSAPNFKTWKEMTTTLGHHRQRIDILKVDIEGYEANVVSALRHDILPSYTCTWPALGMLLLRRRTTSGLGSHAALSGPFFWVRSARVYCPVHQHGNCSPFSFGVITSKLNGLTVTFGVAEHRTAH